MAHSTCGSLLLVRLPTQDPLARGTGLNVACPVPRRWWRRDIADIGIRIDKPDLLLCVCDFSSQGRQRI
eukprot:5217404-Prorocentrum_lima.AAC.1